jgi:hypothetical protein
MLLGGPRLKPLGPLTTSAFSAFCVDATEFS